MRFSLESLTAVCFSRSAKFPSFPRAFQLRRSWLNATRNYDTTKQFHSRLSTKGTSKVSISYSLRLNQNRILEGIRLGKNWSWTQVRNGARNQIRFHSVNTVSKLQPIQYAGHQDDSSYIEDRYYSEELEDYWGIDFSNDNKSFVVDEKIRNKTVVVGISGGVDSSVSALLLKQQGFKNVVGVFMRNWDPQDESGELDTCPISEDFKVAEKVCKQLNIPLHEATFIGQYWTEVFEPYIEILKSGGTPNPDIFCNMEIKFKAFFHYVNQKFGSDALVATGHYARLGKSSKDFSPLLLNSVDSTKDQTYFLCGVGSRALSRVIFPLGSLYKTQVRSLAKSHGLCTAEKKDSVGICFVGKRKFTDFIGNYLDENPGNIVSVDDTKITFGRHSGLFRYTIGQGAKVSGLKKKLFVTGKDPKTNNLFVCEGEDNPALFSKGLYVNPKFMYWVDGEPPRDFCFTGTLRLKCKVRYRQASVWCTLHFENSSTENRRLVVIFDEPEKAVTPMQVVAFYRGDVCLGGGLIGGVVDTNQS
uniref:tRNA-5-taurinomethyluridine 2-sulfurtransferase n=1 Tax=Aplanochytrium stocchinoi TaxID=215587 RepID=A0A7S3LGT0_9STRA|mmetsp:Transcript_5933/g.7752  ORF Transcript_5933/g.7752 Transcript_5933/m.7752 type:complete len:530 (+) Transcript_5933:94-1683(+)